MADQTIETRPAAENMEAIEHNKGISENYKRLLDSAMGTTKERETSSYREETTYPETAPAAPAFVNVDPSSVNAARLADYTPHPAVQQGKKILFEDETYKQGCYTTGPRDTAAAELVYEPVYEAAPAPAPAVSAETEAETEDTRPTARTMQHLQRPAVEEMITEPQNGFWAALTTKTKVLIAAVVTVIVVALMIVCINTAVIGNIDADIANKQLELDRLARRSAELEQQIEYETDPGTIDDWAAGQPDLYR